MNCHFSLLARLIAGCLFILLEGALQINGIEGSKVSANQSFKRASGHSPAFIVGETIGPLMPIESLRGVSGGGGGRGGTRGGGVGSVNGRGFASPTRKRPRVSSTTDNSALKSQFMNLELLFLLSFFSILFKIM